MKECFIFVLGKRTTEADTCSEGQDVLKIAR